MHHEIYSFLSTICQKLIKKPFAVLETCVEEYEPGTPPSPTASAGGEGPWTEEDTAEKKKEMKIKGKKKNAKKKKERQKEKKK